MRLQRVLSHSLGLMMWRGKRYRSEYEKKQRIIQPILSHLIIYLNSRKNPITNRAYIGNTKCTNIRCGQLLWGWERVLFFFLCVFILPFHLYTQSPFLKWATHLICCLYLLYFFIDDFMHIQKSPLFLIFRLLFVCLSVSVIILFS